MNNGTMASNEGKNKQLKDLKSNIEYLITEYEEARDLINDQIQAVIYNDLIWLNSLVEEQLSRYKKLEKLENDFKKSLKGIFRDFCPEENQYSLTVLLNNLEDPSKKLNRLRGELHEQVVQTKQLRDQLMDLLHFASKHNEETFEGIFQLGKDNSESYGSDGKKNTNSTKSVAINQKA